MSSVALKSLPNLCSTRTEHNTLLIWSDQSKQEEILYPISTGTIFLIIRSKTTSHFCKYQLQKLSKIPQTVSADKPALTHLLGNFQTKYRNVHASLGPTFEKGRMKVKHKILVSIICQGMQWFFCTHNLR